MLTFRAMKLIDRWKRKPQYLLPVGLRSSRDLKTVRAFELYVHFVGWFDVSIIEEWLHGGFDSSRYAWFYRVPYIYEPILADCKY